MAITTNEDGGIEETIPLPKDSMRSVLDRGRVDVAAYPHEAVYLTVYENVEPSNPRIAQLTSVDLSPKKARKLAKHLLRAANIAERPE